MVTIVGLKIAFLHLLWLGEVLAASHPLLRRCD